MLTTQQLAERRLGITATDISAILGLNPFRCALDVRDEKRGIKPPQDLGPRVRWGHLLEPPIREDYAERHQVTVTVPGVLTHPTIPHHKATPDGLVWLRGAASADRGLEIKTHTVWLRGGYGAPGSDEVPLHELIQCAWNMYVSGLGRWDLVAFLDGLPTDYIIDRDDELIGDLREAADRFWRDCVVGDKDPDPDGSDAYEQHLRKLKHKTADVVTATPALIEELERLLAARTRRRELTEEVARLEQVIKQAIGEHDGVEFPALVRGVTERITWRQSKGSTAFAGADACAELATALRLIKSAPVVEALAKALGGTSLRIEGGGVNLRAAHFRELVNLIQALDPDGVIAKHTKDVPGSRRFNCPKSWGGKGD